MRLKIEGLFSKKKVLCRLLRRILKTQETSNESLNKCNELMELRNMLRTKYSEGIDEHKCLNVFE